MNDIIYAKCAHFANLRAKVINNRDLSKWEIESAILRLQLVEKR